MNKSRGAGVHGSGDGNSPWLAVARDAREAMRFLGYDIQSRCLPGEPEHDRCGYDAGNHALAHLVGINAIADHQLIHLGAPGQVRARLYAEIADELADGCPQHYHTLPTRVQGM